MTDPTMAVLQSFAPYVVVARGPNGGIMAQERRSTLQEANQLAALWSMRGLQTAVYGPPSPDTMPQPEAAESPQDDNKSEHDQRAQVLGGPSGFRSRR